MGVTRQQIEREEILFNDKKRNTIFAVDVAEQLYKGILGIFQNADDMTVGEDMKLRVKNCCVIFCYKMFNEAEEYGYVSDRNIFWTEVRMHIEKIN